MPINNLNSIIPPSLNSFALWTSDLAKNQLTPPWIADDVHCPQPAWQEFTACYSGHLLGHPCLYARSLGSKESSLHPPHSCVIEHVGPLQQAVSWVLTECRPMVDAGTHPQIFYSIKTSSKNKYINISISYICQIFQIANLKRCKGILWGFIHIPL